MFSPRVQALLHIGLGFAALLLPLLTWWQHVSLAGLGVIACAMLLPGLPGHPLVRGSDPRLPTSALCYALGVLLLIVTFPTRPDLAGCAWGILAAGDGAATLAGRAFGRTRLPWNRHKSIVGSLTFIVCGAAMGFWLAWMLHPHAITDPPTSLRFLLGATLMTAIVAAAVETIPIRLDDNLSVPAVAALMLWCLALISPHADVDAWPLLVRRAVPMGLLLNVSLAIVIWWRHGVSRSGAITGAAIGVAIFAGADPRGWLMLMLAFGAAWATSRIGLARKRVLGIDEAQGGRRGAASALANCGLGALAALGATFTPFHDAALLALVTALTAGAADTVASEIGKAWGGRTVLITNLHRTVAPGTPGGVSLEGSGAGLAWAFVMSAVAGALGLIPFGLMWMVVLAAAIGSLVESALAATLEADHILNNHVLNFLNTFIAVVVALTLLRG
jgi:uncharacterized protein (TIGR00297 family)